MARIAISALSLDPVKGIGAVAFLTPLLTVYVPLSLAIILPVGAVLLLVCRRSDGASLFRFDWPVAANLAGFLIVAALSVFWSHSPDLSLDKLSRMLMAAIAGIFFVTAVKSLDGVVAKRVSHGFLAGVGIALLLVIAERFAGGILLHGVDAQHTRNTFINQFNRPLAILSVFIWPAAVTIAQWGRLWGLGTIGLFVCVLLAFSSSAAAIAVGAGTIVFTAVYCFPRIGAPAVGIVLAASVLLAPTIDRELPPPKELFEAMDLPRSAYHRLLIWEFTTARIDDRPVLGWGLNTSRAMPGGDEKLDVSEKAMPLHPHNAALQWRLELGVLGALFGAGIILVTTEMARRYAAGRGARAGAVAAIGATFVIAMISFGAWQTWWISGMFLIAGFTILACRRPAPG